METKNYKKLQLEGEKYYLGIDLVTVINSLRKSNILTKNKKLNKAIQTFALFLVPFDFLFSVNGKKNCLKIAKICINHCIAFTGILEMLHSQNDLLSDSMKKKIRLQWLLDFYPNLFELLLKEEINREAIKLKKKGVDIKIRLNGTSDLNWSSFIQSMPLISFYDYTKDFNREPMENYHLTYSDTGLNIHWGILEKRLRQGQNVVGVRVLNKNNPFPTSYRGFPTANFDISDDRTLDDMGVYGILKVKVARGGGRSLLAK